MQQNRWPPLAVRHAISQRSHEKIGDFEHSTRFRVQFGISNHE